jgi:predicted transcriptional regulator
MTTDLFTVHADEPLALVVKLMDWKHIRHIPVEDEQGKLVGLVSWLEIVRQQERFTISTPRSRSPSHLLCSKPGLRLSKFPCWTPSL